MKKLITIATAVAWMAAPACAGTNDANQAASPPPMQQNTSSAPRDAPKDSNADKRDDVSKGLSRNSEDCNKGCIGTNGQ